MFRHLLTVCVFRHRTTVVLWGLNAEEVDASELIRRSRREPMVMLAMGCSFKMRDCISLIICVFILVGYYAVFACSLVIMVCCCV